jgi:hypothetical protein
MNFIKKKELDEIYDTLLIGGYKNNNKNNIKSEFIGRGSFFSHQLKYASDIDLNEILVVNENIDKITERFKKMGEKIKDNNHFIFINFRSGRLNYIDIGFVNKFGKIEGFNYDKILKWLDFIPVNQSYIIKKYLKKNIKIEEFLKIRDIVLDNYRINWTLDELIKGKKNNILLKDELCRGTTKIDIIYITKNLDYIEISNLYMFMINNKINDFSETNRYEHLYYRLIEKNYFKAIKLFRSILPDQKNINKKLKNNIRNEIAKFLSSYYGLYGYLLNKLKLLLKLYEMKELNINDTKKIFKNIISNLNHHHFKNIYNHNYSYNSYKSYNIKNNRLLYDINKTINILSFIINKKSKELLKEYYEITKNYLTFDISSYLK